MTVVKADQQISGLTMKVSYDPLPSAQHDGRNVMGWSKSELPFLQVLVKGSLNLQEETGHTISCPLALHLKN